MGENKVFILFMYTKEYWGQFRSTRGVHETNLRANFKAIYEYRWALRARRPQRRLIPSAPHNYPFCLFPAASKVSDFSASSNKPLPTWVRSNPQGTFSIELLQRAPRSLLSFRLIPLGFLCRAPDHRERCLHQANIWLLPPATWHRYHRQDQRTRNYKSNTHPEPGPARGLPRCRRAWDLRNSLGQDLGLHPAPGALSEEPGQEHQGGRTHGPGPCTDQGTVLASFQRGQKICWAR